MKILLIYPLDRDFMPPSMPPMGLAYIAASLKEAGHQITLIDLNGDRSQGLDRLKEILRNESFGMVTISSIITQFKKVRDLGKIVKESAKDTPLVMGGAGPTSIPDLYIGECRADVVCRGEGEETIKELADLIEQEKPLSVCPGISYRDQDNSIKTTPQRQAIRDIDKIDLPAWEEFKQIGTYLENYLFRNGRQKAISILSTRGCPGQCNYCMCNFGRVLRIRSVKNIISEIGMLIDKYGVEHIHFIDDTFVTSIGRMKEFCREFKDAFPRMSWSANARADMVNRNILELMSACGCISLAYGIESGSPTVLKYIRKNITVKQAADAISWTRQAGINLATYFMIGMPCETPQTVKETVEFCKSNLVGGEFFFATPFPGTELYRYARKNGLINNESLYLEHAGEVRDFIINLTSMSNEELFKVKEEAETEIKEYLAKHNIAVKPSIRKDPREAAASLPRF